MAPTSSSFVAMMAILCLPWQNVAVSATFVAKWTIADGATGASPRPIVGRRDGGPRAARSPSPSNLAPPRPLSVRDDESVDAADADDAVEPSRRDFLASQAAAVLGSVAAASPSLAPPRPALATLMDSSVQEAKAFKLGEKIGVEEARRRFVLARGDLRALLDDYDEISGGGGDAVRRYLGTVGVTSYMYGISKVLKELRGEAEDLVEFTEAMNEFNAYMYQADGAAYSSLFVEHSSAKGTPESYLKTAKQDAKLALKYMDELAAQLGL